ncbi:MAG: hypothetical protein ACO39F_07555, partial [Candidatus Nanopelagicaceae bacterium]
FGVTWYSETFTANFGTGAKTFSVVSITEFTAGGTRDITIDTNTGVVRVGSTSAVDTYTVTIRATDSLGMTGTTTLTIRVNEAVAWTRFKTSLGSTAGQPITWTKYPYIAAKGTGDIRYSITGADTTGVTIDSVTGIVTITGTLALGTYTRTITATDSVGATTSRNVSIRMADAIQPVTESSTANDTFTVTTFGIKETSTVITYGFATQGTLSRSWSLSPTVPGITLRILDPIDDTCDECSFSGNTRAVLDIAETTQPGLYYETITITDEIGASGSIVITILVNAALLISGPTSIATTESIAVNETYTSTDGTRISTDGTTDPIFTIQSITKVGTGDESGIT